MDNKQGPPAYGFAPNVSANPTAPPPSYEQATGIGASTASPMQPPPPGGATYYVPPQGAVGEQQQPVITQQIVTTVVTIGPHSSHMVCPICHANINSRTRSSPGLVAWVTGFLLALFG